MAIVTIEETNLTNIAGAIREKNGTQTAYKPSEMAAAIQAISAGSGNGFNTNDYDVTLINAEKYVYDSSDKKYYQWTTWKDYVSSADDIEVLIIYAAQSAIYFYIKGLLEPIDANTLPLVKSSYGSSRWTLVDAADADTTIVFSDKGVLYYNGTTQLTPAQYNSYYLVTKKGVA